MPHILSYLSVESKSLFFESDPDWFSFTYLLTYLLNFDRLLFGFATVLSHLFFSMQTRSCHFACISQVYDTIRYKSLTCTRKLSIQLNLAHVARN